MVARKGIRKPAFRSNKVFKATSSGFGLKCHRWDDPDNLEAQVLVNRGTML